MHRGDEFMIINRNKITYNIIEFTREEILTMLLGGTLENEVKSINPDCEPCFYKTYCTNPTTLDELNMQLKFRKESHEKKFQNHKI
jgi:hypothetical protein